MVISFLFQYGGIRKEGGGIFGGGKIKRRENGEMEKLRGGKMKGRENEEVRK